MSVPACGAPLPFATLVDYWFGELAREEGERLEEHFFACAHCAARLEELAALSGGIRAAFAGGALHAVISPAVLAKMQGEKLRLREYHLAPGGSVQCTIDAADDFVVSRLAASLAGVKRLDLEHQVEGGPAQRFEDIPFDAAAGEVLFCPSAAALRRKPAHTARVRLIAHGEGAQRTLGEYTFDHTPS